MLYRIDLQHFLSHAIDYFTRNELVHFKYILISAKIANLSKSENVTRKNNLWPTPEIIENYEEFKDKKLMEKMYLDFLTITTPDDEYIGDIIYTSFINPIINHQDVVIVCDINENDYIDVLCKHIKDVYSLDCINLNKLFSEGKVGPLYIDKNKIWDKAVDIRRIAGKKRMDGLECTKDGRMELLGLMNKKEKILKLKEIGIKTNKNDIDGLDKLLIDAWVNDIEE